MTTTVIARPSHRAFGRRAIPDPRDLWYLAGEHWPELETSPVQVERIEYRRGPLHSYIGQPVGVACALLAALRSQPRPAASSRCPTVEELNDAAHTVEGTLGRAVTIRAGCRALKQQGLIEQYLWSYDADEIAQYLLSGRGGMVLGLDWYAGMSHPDATGLIRAVGPPEGGHAVFIWGVDRAQGLVFIQNNWGPDWGGWYTRGTPHKYGWMGKDGQRVCPGCAKLPMDDLRKLLTDNGEAVALVKATPSRKSP